MDLAKIQTYLREQKLDGWLLADFHARNGVAMAILNISAALTRRSFYLIPAEGEPTTLVNPIERAKFTHLPGKLIAYRGWAGLESELAQLLKGHERIAMEYSPSGRLPYIGLVDAGTIELVRSSGVEIVSSADLVALFQAALSEDQQASHRRAGEQLIQIKDAAFAHIAKCLDSGDRVTEYDVCDFIRAEFASKGLVTEFGPNCSVDAHAGDPHYDPKPDSSTEIKRGQLILIDLWARETPPGAVYGDITWMAFAGTRDEIPARFVEIFSHVMAARDAAIAFLEKHIGQRPVAGYEVDDACRAVIDATEFGEFFFHRTGHSIAENEHGPGPNIDNLETEDARILQVGHLFSIEPGIYLDDCGFRSEIDCLITANGPEVTTLPLQKEILPLF